MASEDAKNVAREVVETLGKGKKVVLGKIITKHGYSKKTALNPKNVTDTKSYQEIIDPIVDVMVKERERLIKYASKKNLKKVQYESIIRSADLLTKNIQLLTGRRTENSGIGELAEQVNKWITSNK